jgi:hypothetical protein
MAGKNLTTKKAAELLANGRAKARDKHDKSSMKSMRVPQFKVGDRVWILTLVWEGKLAYKQRTPPLAGTVESVPKTWRGSYSVRCDGDDVLQEMDESMLAPMEENAKAAKTGVH